MGRPGALILALAVFLLPGEARGGLTVTGIERQGDFATVRFSYRNDTGSTFSSVVIECATPRALRRTHRGVHYFSNHLSGGIGPGWSGSASVRVPLRGAKETEISCREEGILLIF